MLRGNLVASKFLTSKNNLKLSFNFFIKFTIFSVALMKQFDFGNATASDQPNLYQQELLITAFKENPLLLKRKFKNADELRLNNFLWEDLAQQLNSFNKKNKVIKVDQWHTVCEKYKNHVLIYCFLLVFKIKYFCL